MLVALHLPFDEPIDPAHPRNLPLLESAVNRPFQSAFGEDAYPTIQEKAAALFHSLVCNHCFYNGNKRTAVVAVDLFLLANDYALLMSNEDVYGLAKEAAEANSVGVGPEQILETITERIDEGSMSFALLRVALFQTLVGEEHVAKFRETYARMESSRDSIRSDPRNASANIQP